MANDDGHMGDIERLGLVRSIAQTCKIARNSGYRGWDRILREAVFFFWEIKDLKKFDKQRVHSLNARLLPNSKQKRYDHAIPFRIAREQLIQSCESHDEFQIALEVYIKSVIITKSEDERLNAEGLKSDMPADWDGVDAYARYRRAGIAIDRPQL